MIDNDVHGLGMSLTRLIEDARRQAAQFQQTLEQIEQATDTHNLAKENDELKKINIQLKAENKAIKTAFEKLKQIREKDKLTIKAWQTKLENPINSEEITQDLPKSPVLPTDPPLSYLGSSPPKFSQQALPLSIAVESGDTNVAGSPIEITDRIETQEILPETEPPEPLNSDMQSEVDVLATSQLNKRDWHPEDFVLNPRLKLSAEFEDLAEKQDTPAGFWDVNFPSSSQIERQKAAAKVQIRQEGRKRLREALQGGKYLFKDAKLRRSMSKQ